MTEETIKEEIVRVARRWVDATHFRVLLFGSRAKGQGLAGSDFDVGLDAEGPLSLQSLARMEEALDDLPTLWKVDVVDIKKIDEEFAKTIRRDGVILYEQ